MLQKAFGAAAFIFLFSSFAQAANCLDQARVQSEIFDVFQIQNEDASAKFEACDSKNVTRKVAQALLLVKDLPVVAATPELDLGVVGSDPFLYFKDRIKTIVFDAKGNRSCNSTTMAYVLRGDRDIMHICPYINEFDTLTVAGTLIHEARHTEGFPHVRCDHGLMALGGGLACDPDYETYRGSYAVGTEYLARMALSPNINEPLRQQARSRAVVNLLEKFNKLPLEMKTGALMQAQSGDVYFYDGDNSELLMQVPANSILTTRNSLPTFFDAASAQVKSYLFGVGFVEGGGEYAENFRSKYSAQERESLLDVSYSGDYQCLLFRNKILCGADTDPDVELSLEGLDPVQFVSSSGKSLFVEKDVLYIACADGSLYALPKFWKDFRQMAGKKLQKSLTVSNMMSLVSWKQDQEMAISTQGKALVLTKDRTWVTPDHIPAVRFRKVFAPYYWSKKLEQF